METKSAVLGAAGMLLAGGMAFGLIATANADNQPAPVVVTSTTATATPEPTTAPEPVVTTEAPAPEPTIDSVAGQVVEPAPVEPAPVYVAPEPVYVAPAPAPAPAPVAPAPAYVEPAAPSSAQYEILPPGATASTPEEGALVNAPQMSTGNGKR